LVLHDELDIPVGAAKLKLGGSSGGHNGLKDTQAKLGTDKFWRLRIGIDHPRNSSIALQPVVDYVLKPPKQAERVAIDEAMDKAQAILPDWLAGNFEKAMRVLHAKA
jgi:PTH1 family peptidyl-tRNA hydrolase